MASRTVIFRVDGNLRMGMGHLARCGILAESCLNRGWDVRWVTAYASGKDFLPVSREHIIRLPRAACSSNRAHAEQIRRIAPPGAMVVLDGYHFGFGLERSLRRRGLKVVTIDDNAGRRFSADSILNGNIHAAGLRYLTTGRARLALGPRYFIFSPELRRARRIKLIPRRARKIFVCFGGADPRNQTLKVLKAIQRMGGRNLSVTVVAGPANKHWPRLVSFAGTAGFPCRLIRSSPRIGALMASADVGISSAGRVASEMAYLGLPGLKVVVAENQAGLAGELHRKGAAMNLGWYRRLTPSRIASSLSRLMDDAPLRQKMSERSRSLFDGRGAERIIKILESL